MIDSVVGAVVIGRNEGDRLKVCLNSLILEVSHIVYVDSGSSDDSVEVARGLSVHVLLLDISRPFTAARARNAGFKELLIQQPSIQFVQFIDGDCQLISGWLKSATTFLNKNHQYAVAFGRLSERFPERSVYNMLCDIEWNTALGDVNSCGGIALMRADVFQQVSGFKEDLIAGEEPELCFRFRELGWLIRRLEADMAKHDAAILYFGQWWRRSKRAGFAYAEGNDLHGKSQEKYWRKETRSQFLWGGVLPALVIVLGFTVNPLFFLGGLLYGAQIAKIAFLKPIDKTSRKKSFLYAFYVMLAKFPQCLGGLTYYFGKGFNTKSKIIEYK